MNLRFGFFCFSLVLLLVAALPAADRPAPFGIQVMDAQTGRGVPLVELKTVSGVRYVTDSAGFAAVDDLSLLGRNVFFTFSSHGYSFPADGFGMHGKAVDLKPGGSATVKIKRLNIAERMYRVTGEGIYADSVLLGKKTPIDQPLLNAQVVGQDSVQSAIFRGKLYWFWGDTSRQAYPLGHFGTAGAVSDLPSAGGLPPDVGVNLRYFTDAKGFSKPTFAKEGANPIWLDGLFALKDTDGSEHLIGCAAVQKSLSEVLARRVVEFDPATEMFKPLAEFKVESMLRPNGQAMVADSAGKKYVYLARPYPDVRVPADLASIKDPAKYEAFTCLADGEKTLGKETKVVRDESGKVVWAWRADTVPVDEEGFKKLKSFGKLKADENWFRTKDAKSGRTVLLHGGSVNWNEFRKKWVMIAVEFGGKTSFLGDVWYLESSSIQGPWESAVQVLSHDKYSFYNPVHHVHFDQEGGRFIYFEGTYTYTFSRKDDVTPRYDYNQMMYRLDLADERLRK